MPYFISVFSDTCHVAVTTIYAFIFSQWKTLAGIP